MSREGFAAWNRDRPSVVAFDTETTGLDFYDTPFCVTAAWRNDLGVEAHYFELDSWHHRNDVSTILSKTPLLVGHNIKFDLQKCILAGLISRGELNPSRIGDTELVAHLLDEHRVKKLKTLAHTVLGLETDEDEAVKAAKKIVKKELGLRSESEIGYHMLPREVVVPYAIKDAEFTLLLWEALRPGIDRYTDLLALFEQERELTLVLLDMESAGMRLDVDYMTRTTKAYGGKILAQENLISGIVGRTVGRKKDEFNPASPKQLMEWFEDTGIALSSTNKSTLKKVDHDLARALLEYRNLQKMHGTYLLPFLHEHRDGIVHPNFRQNVRTGRMASGGAEG